MPRRSRPLRKSLRGTGTVHTAAVELTEPDSVKAATDATVKALGRVDILVNNAGIAGVNKKVWEFTPDEWQQVIQVNLVGVFLCCRAIVPGMIEHGYGRIVNIASIAGKEGNPNASHYSASKAGVIALTKSLAKETARYRRDRELHRAGRHRNRHLQADVAGAHRLHALEDPDGPIWHEGRGGRAGRVVVLGRLLVQYRRGLRSLGRARDLLKLGESMTAGSGDDVSSPTPEPTQALRIDAAEEHAGGAFRRVVGVTPNLHVGEARSSARPDKFGH